MTEKSLKNFSLEQIEACVAKALSELTGQDVGVTINAIEHPSTGLTSISGAWRAAFEVQAAFRPPAGDWGDPF